MYRFHGRSPKTSAYSTAAYPKHNVHMIIKLFFIIIAQVPTFIRRYAISPAMEKSHEIILIISLVSRYLSIKYKKWEMC